MQLTPNCSYWKAHGTVFVTWYSNTALTSGWTIVNTLPEGFRPTAGFEEDGLLRVDAPAKLLGSAGADSTGHIDARSDGLVRVWVPRATSATDRWVAQLFFTAM